MSEPIEVFLVTKNQDKLMAARSVFSKYGIGLVQLDKDYPEIQADTSLEVARFTALNVAKEERLNVIREDHGIFFGSLGFPGPYANFMNRKIPEEMLLEFLNSVHVNKGHIELSAVYAQSDGRHKEYSYHVPFSVAEEPRGSFSKGWNRVIILDGEERTLAEYREEDRLDVFNKNFHAIAKDLLV